MKLRRGFTLLELLVAMAASALLLALLSQVSGSLQAAAQRVVGGGAELPASEARARQALLRLLSDVLPAADGDTVNGFSGHPQSVEFTAVPPDALLHLGPVRVRLLEAPVSAAQMGLFIEMRSARDAGKTPEVPRRELLRGGLQSVRFSYAADRGPGAPVLDHWPAAGAPPGWIQVVWRRAGDLEQSAALAAAVRRSLPGDCRFDPISLICRAANGR
jgi:prepilin-type N-terminal cleavage/methylation domain-containing protein